MGTDFAFEKTDGGTRVREILYFEIFPPLLAVVPVFGLWRAFRPAACRQHILDELTGIKTLIESGDYAPGDVTGFMADPALAARVKRHRPALHREQGA